MKTPYGKTSLWQWDPGLKIGGKLVELGRPCFCKLDLQEQAKPTSRTQTPVSVRSSAGRLSPVAQLQQNLFLSRLHSALRTIRGWELPRTSAAEAQR